ncbi:hypothetical protein C8Q80DRAFT_1357486 [Daedaleopsis nitida]|nr:hypothetical protein C8Q80DRAFT_1357486 [Daedaleopsis nitida]
MVPPMRQSNSLTTDYDIPVATSEVLPPPPSVRRSARIATSSKAPALRGAPHARTLTLTTAATTPARPPPRTNKGKGKEVARPQRAISVDPNLPPFRDPSYTAVDYDLERTPPPRPQARVMRATSPQGPDEESEDESDSELPYVTKTGLVYDYPPPDPSDQYWLDEMIGALSGRDLIKERLTTIRAQVSERLLESTIATMELNDVIRGYEQLMDEIGMAAGKDYQRFLRDRADELFVPSFDKDGVVHVRPRPAPQRPRTPQRGHPAEGLSCRIPAMTVMMNSAQQAPVPSIIEPGSPAVERSSPPVSSPTHNASVRVQTRRGLTTAATSLPKQVSGQPMPLRTVAEHRTRVETQSSPPVSSPSNNASVRAQKRRRAATETPTQVYIDFSTHASKKRRTGADWPSARPRRFAYSPLPPSSPVRTERSSSEERETAPPAGAVLSPVAEVQGETSRQQRSLESDDDWLNSIANSNGEPEADVDEDRNTHTNAHSSVDANITPNDAPAPPVLGPAPVQDTAVLSSAGPKRWSAEQAQAFWEKYWPVYIPPPSSQLDIQMAWSPLPDKDVDRRADAGSSSSPVANVAGGEASERAQPQAGPSTYAGFGESVSGALIRAKSKGKGRAVEPAAAAVSPGAGVQLAWRQYTREEEQMLWPEYNSNLLS